MKRGTAIFGRAAALGGDPWLTIATLNGPSPAGLNTRALRNLAGIGNDNFVYNYMQSQITGFAGTALGAFGSAQSGMPASVVAPSLLFDELEVRGARGEPKRLPLLPAPPMNTK